MVPKSRLVLLAKRDVDQRNLSIPYDAAAAHCPWPLKTFRILPHHLFLRSHSSLQGADP